jgi:hypothetical protein
MACAGSRVQVPLGPQIRTIYKGQRVLWQISSMMKNKRILLGIIGLLILVIGLAIFAKISNILGTKGKKIVKSLEGSNLLIEECSDKSYIAKEADYIIEGTVEKVESKWNEDKTSILTYTNFRIENYVKGNPFKEKMLQFITSGGKIGEIGQVVTDEPIFHPDKKVRVYLKEINGELSTICGPLGAEDLSEIEEKTEP